VINWDKYVILWQYTAWSRNKVILQILAWFLNAVFSTAVLQKLRVPPIASKGSAESNLETGSKWHLRPLDTFSGLSGRPKWSGLCPKPRWGSLLLSPRPCSLLPPFQEPLPHSQPSSSISRFPPSQICHHAIGSVSNQSSCKVFCFKEKVQKFRLNDYKKKNRTQTVKPRIIILTF